MPFFSSYSRYRLSLVLMIGIFLIIGIYSYFKTAAILSGPEITVISPTTGSTYGKELAIIKGQADRIAKIYLNNRQIFTDDEGRFSEPLLLFAGYNILTLQAEDSFGRTVTKRIELHYKG